MALAHHTRPAPFGAISIFNFVSRVDTVVKSLADWNVKRKTTKVLSQLSDRELADIGLIRGDLDNLPNRI